MLRDVVAEKIGNDLAHDKYLKMLYGEGNASQNTHEFMSVILDSINRHQEGQI